MTILPADRRRVLIGAAAALGLATAPRLARSQEKPARIGWLHLRRGGPYATLTERGFRAGLEQAGYVEGRNLVFVHRSAEGQVRRLRALAREIVAEGVDVFFAPAKPMADAAWYASRRIPTVIATPRRIDSHHRERPSRSTKKSPSGTNMATSARNSRRENVNQSAPGIRSSRAARRQSSDPCSIVDWGDSVTQPTSAR